VCGLHHSAASPNLDCWASCSATGWYACTIQATHTLSGYIAFSPCVETWVEACITTHHRFMHTCDVT
jgi:hypothetical protein